VITSNLIRLKGQEVPSLLWNHNRVHNISSRAPVLSHINNIHPFQNYFTIIFNIILSYMSTSFQWLLTFKRTKDNSVLLYAPYMPPLTSSSLIWSSQYLAKSTNCGSPHYAVFSSLLSLHPSYNWVTLFVSFSCCVGKREPAFRPPSCFPVAKFVLVSWLCALCRVVGVVPGAASYVPMAFPNFINTTVHRSWKRKREKEIPVD
jgi:hypothetical protein